MSELNEIFREFAGAFAGAFEDAKPICFPEQLDQDQLDLSLESLRVVDRYLNYLYQHRANLLAAEWHNTVLYAGAYVGEVIRNETDNHFQWVDYDEYVPLHPELKQMIPDRTTPTCAFLVDDERMSMPLNKIARYIDEGSQHSVHYFAVCDIDHAKKHLQ